jgi:hypothetical protein
VVVGDDRVVEQVRAGKKAGNVIINRNVQGKSCRPRPKVYYGRSQRP